MKTWDVYGNRAQNKEIRNQQKYDILLITTVCYSNHPQDYWQDHTLGKRITVVAQLNINRNPVLCTNMKRVGSTHIYLGPCHPMISYNSNGTTKNYNVGVIMNGLK